MFIQYILMYMCMYLLTPRSYTIWCVWFFLWRKDKNLTNTESTYTNLVLRPLKTIIKKEERKESMNLIKEGKYVCRHGKNSE